MRSLAFLRQNLVSITVLLFGVLSIVLLVSINRINQRQDANFAFADVVMEFQLRTATFHLWLEELLAGETDRTPKEVLADVRKALELVDALQNGGKSEEGLTIEPTSDPKVRLMAEKLTALLHTFKRIALMRLQDPVSSGIGSDIDRRFDSVFKEIFTLGKSLEIIAEEKQTKARAQSEKLSITIVLVWGVIVFLAVSGIWNHELKRKAAEKALKEAKDDLEQRVEERTRDLSGAIENLHAEIAERKRAEEEIRLYEEIVRNMPIGLYVGSIEEDEGLYSIIAANPVAVQTIGAKQEQILGKFMTPSFFDMLLAGPSQVYEEVIRMGKVKDSQSSPNGEATDNYISLVIFPLPNRCIGVVFKDVSERKRAELALRESESKFKKLSLEFDTLLNAIPDSITLLSPERKILWSNRGAFKGNGANSPDLIGRYCHEAWPNQSTECVECPALKSFRTGKMETANIACPDGTYWDVRSFPVKNEDGTVNNVIELAADVTDKMARQEETMRAARLASIGELAAGVAHEINNPIGGIINCAELLYEESEQGSRGYDIAERIIKQGGRIADIVRGLLSFSRDAKQEKVRSNIEEILADSLTLIESQLRKNGIKLIRKTAPDLPEILVNPQQIQQVFLNIINNARYALNERYPSVHENKILEIVCENLTINNEKHLRVTFHDHGTGIPSELMNRVLIPFFSTKPFRKGTGLGLSISEGIISDHGGKLRISSIKGEFTKVAIVLPALEIK